MAEKKGGKEKHKRKKNTERGRLNGGRHLRGKTHGKRVGTPREGPRKRKDQKWGTTHGRRVIRN